MLPVAFLAAALALPVDSDDTPLALVRAARASTAPEVWAKRLRAEGLERRFAGRPADALPLFTAAVLLRPDDPYTVGGRAKALDLLGRHDEAADDYARAVALAPNDCSTWVGVGEGWIARGKFAEAEQCFERAVRLTPDGRRAVVRLWQAFAWLRAEEVPLDAPADGPEYSEPGSRSSELRTHRHVTPEQIGRASAAQQARAETALSDALSRAAERDHPLRGALLYSRGLLRMEHGLRKAAAADFEESLTHRPTNHYAHEKLANLAADRGDYPEALRRLDRAAECGMPRLDELLKRGAWLELAGEYEKAERCAAEVCELDPANATVLRVHAKLLWHFGKDDAAEALMHRAAAAGGLSPSGEAFYEMVYLNQQFNDLAAAERVAARLLARPDLLREQRYQVLLTLGTLHMRASREEEAFDEWTRAVRLIPRVAEGRLARAGLALRLQRYAAAVEDAEALVRLNPDEPAAHALWRQVRGMEEMSAALAGRPPDLRPAGPVVRVPMTGSVGARKFEEWEMLRRCMFRRPGAEAAPVTALASQR